MDASAIGILVATVVAVAAIAVHLIRRPGPDARGTTKPPVSQRRNRRFRDVPEYPGEGRPAGPGAEGQAVMAPGEISTNGTHTDEHDRRHRRS